MSEISSKPHQLCGALAGVPLYHPTAAFSLHGDNLKVDERHLLLGGGSGEHPVLRYHIPTLAADFILGWVGGVTGFDVYMRQQLFTKIEPVILAPEEDDEGSWDGGSWYEFINNAKSNLGYNHPYDISKMDEGSIEEWIRDSLGEYVIVAMLDVLLSFVPEGAHAQLTKFSEKLAMNPFYCNVIAFPRGYEKLGGNTAGLDDGNVRH